MRVISRFFAVAVIGTALLAGPAIHSRPAFAQCGMGGGGGGGGHDHGARGEGGQKKPSSSEKKQRESVARLLGDDQGRMVLMNALLEDRDFMWAFIPRIATVPEWHGLMALRLSQIGPDSSIAPATSEQAALYVCPMHPEVTSAKPGPCPKCGMALEERAAHGASH